MTGTIMQGLPREPQRQQQGEAGVAQVRAPHKQVTVGEVDELEDAVDHGVTEGHERVERADGHAVEDVLGE